MRPLALRTSHFPAAASGPGLGSAGTGGPGRAGMPEVRPAGSEEIPASRLLAASATPITPAFSPRLDMSNLHTSLNHGLISLRATSNRPST